MARSRLEDRSCRAGAIGTTTEHLFYKKLGGTKITLVWREEMAY
jgi:hypothetical protein